MKRTLLLSLAVLCVAGLAMAQPNVGSIGVFSDAGASSCDITDVGGLVTAYIVHVNAAQANTSRFKLEPTGVGLTLVGENVTSGMLSLGNVSNGITITYGSCRTTYPLLLVTLSYIGSGTTVGCGKLSIVADPAVPAGQVQIIDCSANERYIGAVAGSALVSTDGSCGCDIATEPTSWSKVKALYQ